MPLCRSALKVSWLTLEADWQWQCYSGGPIEIRDEPIRPGLRVGRYLLIYRMIDWLINGFSGTSLLALGFVVGVFVKKPTNLGNLYDTNRSSWV